MTKLISLLLLGLVAIMTNAYPKIKVGSFNVQVFGKSKMEEFGVPTILRQIIPNYDILFFQEIRDSSDTHIHDLLNLVNKNSRKKFKMVLSERLGSTDSKEQYAYFYDDKRVTLHDYKVVKDGLFERSPYLALWSSVLTPFRFSTLGIHIKPNATVTELERLYYYSEQIQSRSNTGYTNHPLMILGDLNADCSYLTKSEYPTLKLAKDQSYTWAFAKGQTDTTVGYSKCTYDQFILKTPTTCVDAQVSLKGQQVFNMTTTYGLTHDQTKLVSDHHPIEVTLGVKPCNGATNPPVSKPPVTTKPQPPVATKPKPPAKTKPKPPAKKPTTTKPPTNNKRPAPGTGSKPSKKARKTALSYFKAPILHKKLAGSNIGQLAFSIDSNVDDSIEDCAARCIVLEGESFDFFNTVCYINADHYEKYGNPLVSSQRYSYYELKDPDMYDDF